VVLVYPDGSARPPGCRCQIALFERHRPGTNGCSPSAAQVAKTVTVSSLS
jgi:hypothetical protein